MKSYDAIIVGARCAGSATARLLAEQGRDVLVLDRARFPSDTVSTHLITTGGVSLLRRWGLLETVLATQVALIRSFNLTIGDLELHDPVPMEMVSPRRIVLDKVLVDAAVAAGAEMREAVTVHELVREDGAVVGVRGHDSAGAPFEERAAMVIGADGVRSLVARAVAAPEYDQRPSRGSGCYAYFRGMPMDAVELAFGTGCFAGVFPTNDGQACVFAARPEDEFGRFRDDTEGAHAATVGAASCRLGEGIVVAQRQSRFFTFRATPGFFRLAAGPGWALVGDAGYHKDPVTGHGITDAFRDAHLLASGLGAGLDAGLAGWPEKLAGALDGYTACRDRLSAEVYAATQEIAALEWTEASLIDLFLRFVTAVNEETAAIAALA